MHKKSLLSLGQGDPANPYVGSAKPSRITRNSKSFGFKWRSRGLTVTTVIKVFLPDKIKYGDEIRDGPARFIGIIAPYRGRNYSPNDFCYSPVTPIEPGDA